MKLNAIRAIQADIDHINRPRPRGENNRTRGRVEGITVTSHADNHTRTRGRVEGITVTSHADNHTRTHWITRLIERILP